MMIIWYDDISYEWYDFFFFFKKNIHLFKIYIFCNTSVQKFGVSIFSFFSFLKERKWEINTFIKQGCVKVIVKIYIVKKIKKICFESILLFLTFIHQWIQKKYHM